MPMQLVQRTRYYHDGQNMIAEYTQSGETQTLARTYVHGTQYIDERAVMRDHVGSQDYYYLLEELYSVAGLVESIGSLAEAAVRRVPAPRRPGRKPPMRRKQEWCPPIVRRAAFSLR